MMEKVNFRSITEGFWVLENIHDVVRIVEPVQNTIMQMTNENDFVSMREGSCYGFWKKGKFCDNCISLRAVTEHDTFVKFEVVEERIYMITASPLDVGDGFHVIEMLDDITGQSIFETIVGKNPKDFTSLVLRMNDALVRDELTKIFNRRYINERLPVEILNTLAGGNPSALIMIDIDRFKMINDNYGHLAGDMILEQFAQLLVKNVQNDRDWVARYGGEEFLFYLNNTDDQQALKVAERVRSIIGNFKFIIPNETIHITCSLGVCNLQKDMDMQMWIDHADKNLYVAKACGGNKVVASID